MANYDGYKRTLDSLANLNLTSDQQQIQRRPLPPTSASSPSTRNLPPPPPPYNFSKNQKNSALPSPSSTSNASIETQLPPYYTKNHNPGYINVQPSVPQTENKPKLPYNVKLSKVPGTSAAELKLAQLEQQIEKDMEEQEKQECFGDCVACGKKVIGSGKACKAMDQIYHSACFVCNSCGRSLREKAFYNVNGRIYCEEDYLYSGFQQTSEKCAACGHLIMEMILQAMGQYYHPGCFRCCMCNECLDGVPFTVDFDNKIYCVNDFHRIFAPVCNICNLSITPVEGTEETVRVVAMEKDFHVDCYVCESCGMQLTDEPEKRCYPLGDRLYCRSCNIRQQDKLGYSTTLPKEGYGVSMKTFRE